MYESLIIRLCRETTIGTWMKVMMTCLVRFCNRHLILLIMGNVFTYLMIVSTQNGYDTHWLPLFLGF